MYDKDAAMAARRIGGRLAHNDIDRQEIYDALALALSGTLEEMRDTFPSLDKAQGHENRRQNVWHVLEMAKEKVVEVLKRRIGLEEATLREDLDLVFNALENMVVTAGKYACRLYSPNLTIILFPGNIVEQHPILAETFIIAGSVLLGALIPEWFI
jgi:hypothetical protein